jgi:colanic acid biosynthesis glycosyl transferase WcaI
MKILLLTQYFAPEVGAAQVRLSALCRELRAEGHQVEVVTAMPNHPTGAIFPSFRGRFCARESLDGFTVHRVWLYAATGGGVRRLLSYFSFMVLSIFGLLRAQKPDYLFVESPPLFLAIPAWIAARLWHARLIFNVADLWPDAVLDLGVMQPGMATRAAFALEKWAYARADFLNAITEGVRDVLIRKKHVPSGKILFLPNGVDTALFQPSSQSDEELRSLLRLQGKKIVLYAGNHGYAVGLDQLLAAASLLTDPSVHFLLLGDGPEKPQLQKLAENLGLTNVTFVDTVSPDRLPAFLSITDVAAITLRRSGIAHGIRPAKLFVMMAAAKPVVLAAEGESATLVRQANAGVVVRPHSPQELADAISFLLKNPAVAAKLGANGRAFVQSQYDWSLLVRNWLGQLERATPEEVVHAPRAEKSTAPTVSS